MNNIDAANYARIALLNLKEANMPIATDTLLYEMCELFDIYDEKSIADEAYKRL